MNLDLLDTLRDKMVNGKDFAEVYTYFMDHFGEDREFLAIGKPTRSERVELALGQLVGSILKKNTMVTIVMLLRIPGTKFLHGGFTAEEGLGTFFYFEELDMGMAAAFFRHFNGQTAFLRFTGMPMPAPSNPRRN